MLTINLIQDESHRFAITAITSAITKFSTIICSFPDIYNFSDSSDSKNRKNSHACARVSSPMDKKHKNLILKKISLQLKIEFKKKIYVILLKIFV